MTDITERSSKCPTQPAEDNRGTNVAVPVVEGMAATMQRAANRIDLGMMCW